MIRVNSKANNIFVDTFIKFIIYVCALCSLTFTSQNSLLSQILLVIQGAENKFSD